MPGILSNLFADGGQTSTGQSNEIMVDLDVDVSLDLGTSYQASWTDGDGTTHTRSGEQDIGIDLDVDALLGVSSDQGLVMDLDHA